MLTRTLPVQGSSADGKELLLDIYSNINEPDSIYAVANGHSMKSQLRLYEHEGNWDKALTGYDLLCRQHAVPDPQGLSEQATGSPKQVTGEWQQGLLTSLQQLGCRHVIEAYWQQAQAQSAGKHIIAARCMVCIALSQHQIYDKATVFSDNTLNTC